MGFAVPVFFTIGCWLFAAIILVTVLDMTLLWTGNRIQAFRYMADRFSNGDDNEVDIRVESDYPFRVRLDIIDEIPFVFQRRDINFKVDLKAREGKNVKYRLRPVERGDYSFGLIRVFVRTLIGFVERRYSLGEPRSVKVYPSYLMLTHYELIAISDNLKDYGIKRVRRIGQNTEFEEIKEYVKGDDFRHINWRATARKGSLMVNVYGEERSQQVISIIDKGRVMRQTSNGMTLLDYAINASLVLSFVAMNRDDKAGLITFADDFETFIPPSRRSNHMQRIMESLYNESTDFGESDYSGLVVNVNKLVSKRSLLVLYTSFADMHSMKRQLPYLMQLSTRHRVLVVFFADDELREYIGTSAETNEEYYQHVIAEKFDYEQRLIVSKLKQYGILSLLTRPEDLSVKVINKYLEIKKYQS